MWQQQLLLAALILAPGVVTVIIGVLWRRRHYNAEIQALAALNGARRARIRNLADLEEALTDQKRDPIQRAATVLTLVRWAEPGIRKSLQPELSAVEEAFRSASTWIDRMCDSETDKAALAATLRTLSSKWNRRVWQP